MAQNAFPRWGILYELNNEVWQHNIYHILALFPN